MTADEAIFKMLVQVLKNQRSALWAAWVRETNDNVSDTLCNRIIETTKLMDKVMEK